MKAKEFIAELSKKLGKSQAETSDLVDFFLTDIIKGLQDGKSVALQDLGVFEVKKKAERISVNPATQQRMLVPPKLVLAFKPHNKLKEKFK